MARHADDGARFSLRPQVLVVTESVRAGVAVVIQKKGAGQVFAHTVRNIGLVMHQVIAEIVLAAADGVDAGEVSIRIGAPRAGLAHGVGIEIGMQVERLAAEPPRQVEHQVLVAVIAVRDRPVVVGSRAETATPNPSNCPPPETPKRRS